MALRRRTAFGGPLCLCALGDETDMHKCNGQKGVPRNGVRGRFWGAFSSGAAYTRRAQGSKKRPRNGVGGRFSGTLLRDVACIRRAQWPTKCAALSTPLVAWWLAPRRRPLSSLPLGEPGFDSRRGDPLRMGPGALALGRNSVPVTEPGDAFRGRRLRRV